MIRGYDAGKKNEYSSMYGFDNFSEGRKVLMDSNQYNIKNEMMGESGFFSNVGSIVSNTESYSSYKYSNNNSNITLKWIRDNGGSLIHGNNVFNTTYLSTQPSSSNISNASNQPMFSLYGDMLLGVEFSTLGSNIKKRKIGIINHLYSSNSALGIIPFNTTTSFEENVISDFYISYEDTGILTIFHNNKKKTYNVSPKMIDIGKKFFMKIDSLGYVFIGDGIDRLSKIATLDLVSIKNGFTDVRYSFFYQMTRDSTVVITPNTSLIDIVKDVTLKYSPPVEQTLKNCFSNTRYEFTVINFANNSIISDVCSENLFVRNDFNEFERCYNFESSSTSGIPEIEPNGRLFFCIFFSDGTRNTIFPFLQTNQNFYISPGDEASNKVIAAVRVNITTGKTTVNNISGVTFIKNNDMPSQLSMGTGSNAFFTVKIKKLMSGNFNIQISNTSVYPIVANKTQITIDNSPKIEFISNVLPQFIGGLTTTTRPSVATFIKFKIS